VSLTPDEQRRHAVVVDRYRGAAAALGFDLDAPGPNFDPLEVECCVLAARMLEVAERISAVTGRPVLRLVRTDPGAPATQPEVPV